MNKFAHVSNTTSPPRLLASLRREIELHRGAVLDIAATSRRLALLHNVLDTCLIEQALLARGQQAQIPIVLGPAHAA